MAENVNGKNNLLFAGVPTRGDSENINTHNSNGEKKEEKARKSMQKKKKSLVKTKHSKSACIGWEKRKVHSGTLNL